MSPWGDSTVDAGGGCPLPGPHHASGPPHTCSLIPLLPPPAKPTGVPSPRCAGAQRCWPRAQGERLPPGPPSPLTLGDGLSCAGAFIHQDADSACPPRPPAPTLAPPHRDPAPQNWGSPPQGQTAWGHGGPAAVIAHSPPQQRLAPAGMWAPPNVGQSAAAVEVCREKRCWEDEEGAGGRCRGAWIGGTPAPEGIWGRAKFLPMAAMEELSRACSHQ